MIIPCFDARAVVACHDVNLRDFECRFEFWEEKNLRESTSLSRVSHTYSRAFFFHCSEKFRRGVRRRRSSAQAS
jgi:hypothetical protein